MATLRFGRKAPTLTDYLGVTSPRKSRKDGYYRIVNLSYNVPLGGWEYGAMTIDEVEAWLKRMTQQANLTLVQHREMRVWSAQWSSCHDVDKRQGLA